jgi:hypothetical protein
VILNVVVSASRNHFHHHHHRKKEACNSNTFSPRRVIEAQFIIIKVLLLQIERVRSQRLARYFFFKSNTCTSLTSSLLSLSFSLSLSCSEERNVYKYVYFMLHVIVVNDPTASCANSESNRTKLCTRPSLNHQPT